MSEWNKEFERGLVEAEAKRNALTITLLAIQWWMRPTADAFADLMRTLEDVTGVSKKQHRTRKVS